MPVAEPARLVGVPFCPHVAMSLALPTAVRVSTCESLRLRAPCVLLSAQVRSPGMWGCLALDLSGAVGTEAR